jgi:TRAP-type transport system small permease protein
VLRFLFANATEGACLLLMVVLSVDVLLGVFSRYVLVQTFTWYDEIARICFVWVVFLGAAVGVKRQVHFRLHTLVNRLIPRGQHAAEALGLLVVMALAAVLIHQGWSLVQLGQFQQTPVMGLPKSWVYLAIPVGGALMILYALPLAWRALAGLLSGRPMPEPHLPSLGEEEHV